MKRCLAILLAAMLVAGCLTGCGQNDGQGSGQTQQSSQQDESSQEQSREQEPSSGEGTSKTPIVTEPVTVSILTCRHEGTTNGADELWFFKYLEYWLSEQGYDVTIDVQQTEEPETAIQLMLNTNSLPDLVWGAGINATNMVKYGATEHIILDWTPYINEETMPNLHSAFQADASALDANICIDGGIYGLPYLSMRQVGGPMLTFGMVDRCYVNSTWLKQCDLEIPANIEEFLDMLRAFKEKITLENGDEVIPLIENANFFEKFLWTCLGFYGNDLSKYGNSVAIKDGEIVVPAYTEQYKAFMEILNTCYSEGLISPDYFTMDSTTATGLAQAGVCGVLCDWTLGNTPDYAEWVEIPPFPIGDTDEIAISLGNTYGALTWASAGTEHPELLALIMDYLYSPEGAMLYNYGPQEGQDPLGLVDGFTVKEDGTITTKLVEEGKFPVFQDYARQYIYSWDYVGYMVRGREYARELGGYPTQASDYSITDVITGQAINGKAMTNYTHDNADGHWRLVSADAVEPYLTAIRLPAAFVDEEDAIRLSDISSVTDNHIDAESAKFASGLRPLNEIDAFQEELKGMNIEDLLEINRKAYSTFLSGYFD